MAARQARRGELPRLLVFSDLDGCLLDAKSYSWEAARPALAALAARAVPLVLCSSKTRAEMSPLARTLGLNAPFVVENGGALVFPPGCWPPAPSGSVHEDPHWLEVLGAGIGALRPALEELAQETGANVLPLSSLDVLEIARLTGLSPAAAEQARQREFDEPFLLEDGTASPDELERAARRRGLRLTHGGRFWHLTGASDKGRAALRLVELFAGAGLRAQTVAFGDAPNDDSLLRAVERPFLVPRPDGTVDPHLARTLPHAERAPRPGPAGWNAAVLRLLAA